MLEAMRHLALDFLFRQVGKGNPPSDMESWFQKIRGDRAGEILSYLVESGEKICRVYVLKPDSHDENLVHLEAEDLTKEKFSKIPFVKPSGSQSAAIGPVIKRTYKAKEKEAGPSAKIINTTIESFRELAASKQSWKGYFSNIVTMLEKRRLLFNGKEVKTGGKSAYPTILHAAISEIDERNTVYLTITDQKGLWPGQRPEYIEYLLRELSNIKYLTQATPETSGQVCPLCGRGERVLYPNAVKGAGINIGNADRIGAFPGINSKNAWKGYALCTDCADLLYIYKNHVSNSFRARIADEQALLLPYTSLDGKLRQKFLKDIEHRYISGVEDGVATREDRLLRIMTEEPAVISLSIIWAKFGQNIEDLRGIITDVLPSRLGLISRFNHDTKSWQHPLFPVYPVTGFSFNLAMICLFHVFKRPGGKKAKQINASIRLFELKRNLIAALYHGERIDEGEFWREIMTTASWYIIDALSEGSGWGMLNEGVSKDKNEPYLTMAGWIRHSAQLVYYLKKMGVFSMEAKFYEPRLDDLKPYFGPESGIDGKEKAFAFLLGILYGKVIQVQAARHVNVGANALTWLRRLTLSGKDLPELYVKVREKMLAYETEGNEKVRLIVEEVGSLGTKLGSNINLDETNTCYFLLLGQSMTTTIIPSKTKNNEKGEVRQ